MAHIKFKPVNSIRSEAKAEEILAAAIAERPSLIGKNGNAKHGFELRYRNRLMSEAGYGYNDAYYAVAKISRAA